MKPEQTSRNEKLRMIEENLAQRTALHGSDEPDSHDESRQAWMLDEIKRLDKELESETNRHHLLGEALTKVLIADGVLRNGATPSGPELLVAVDSYLESKGFTRLSEELSVHDKPSPEQLDEYHQRTADWNQLHVLNDELSNSLYEPTHKTIIEVPVVLDYEHPKPEMSPSN